MSELEDIKAEISRLNRRLKRLTRGPKLGPGELQAFLDHHAMSQSDFAEKIWGRGISSEGKNVAKNRDRVSVWVHEINSPSRANMQKILAVFVEYL